MLDDVDFYDDARVRVAESASASEGAIVSAELELPAGARPGDIYLARQPCQRLRLPV